MSDSLIVWSFWIMMLAGLGYALYSTTWDEDVAPAPRRTDSAE